MRWIDDETLSGRLDSEPYRLQDRHIGDEVAFSPKMIEDWMFFGEWGEIFGSFSTRVVLGEMHQATAREIESL